MVRIAPHRGGVAKRGIATEKLCIELQRQSKAKKCQAAAKYSENSIETFGAVYSKGNGRQ